MKHLIAILILSFMSASFATQETNMNEYQQKIMERRTIEARELWKEMVSKGFNQSSVAALDFTFFSDSDNESNNLVTQLSENYTVEKVPSSEQNIFLIKGTTRPYGNEFNYEQWLGWVDFMVTVGFSHNSVFSTWSVYEPKSKQTWSSESIEVQ